MMRKDQKTMVAFGRSSFGNSFNAGTCLSRLWVRIRLPRAGISRPKRVRSCSISGQPNSRSGVGSPGGFSQWPSMAAIFAGWCFKVLSPCISPTSAWTGATINVIHNAMENMVRIAGVFFPRSKCQAAEAPTNSALLRNAAIDMCRRR